MKDIFDFIRTKFGADIVQEPSPIGRERRREKLTASKS